MGLYKRGTIWWLSFVDKGRRLSTSTKQTDRRLAERWAASYRAAVHEDRFLPQPKDATVGEILERYLEVHLKPKNTANYSNSRYKVRQILGKVPAGAPVSGLRAMADEYRAWRTQCRTRGKSDKTVAAATVNRELSILKAATRKALQWGLISSDPLAGFKLAKLSNARVRYIEDEEFERLVNAAHPGLVPIVLIARHTGMRQSEILNLEWSDVDLRRGWTQIRHSKNGEGRFVPLSSELVEMLAATPLSERTGFIFQRHGARMKRDGWLRAQFTKAVRRAGLIDFHFHDLRHCWASHAAMRGADPQTMAAILGHKTLRMTQRYSHLSSTHLKASIELAAPRKSLKAATKSLQSDSSQMSISQEEKCPQTKTPPFLAGFRSGELVEVMGFEPTASSLRRPPRSASEASIKRISRRKYDPNAN
jgi:integrase